MTTGDLDLRLLRFRSRRDEYPHALASALVEAGRSHDALEVIHLGLLDNESDVELLTLEGRAFYDQGELREAQRALLRAAKANPQHKEPYRWLAQVLIERGDPRRAAQVLERAIALDPGDASLRQAHQRAQRLAGLASLGKHPSSRPGPRSEPAPGRPVSQPPSKVTTPGALGAAAQQPAANHNTLTGTQRGLPDFGARTPVRRSRTGNHDLLAEDLLREPGGDAPDPDAGTNSWEIPRDQPAKRRRLHPELEHDDDDSPTTSVDLPEELRALRSGERPEEGLLLPSDDDDEEEEEQATSVMQAGRELEMLKRGDEPGEEEGQDDTVLDDVPTLALPGEPEPPEQVLDVLQKQGIFETAKVPVGPGVGWARQAESPRAGTPVRNVLAAGWLFAVLAAVGGYGALQAWLGKRKAEAAALVQRASGEALDGQHEALVAAEKHLLEARELDPKSEPALEALMFVQALRALEESEDQLAPLRETLARAEQADYASPLTLVATALARPPEKRFAGVDPILAAVRRDADKDPRVAYLAGRFAQRAGKHEPARELLAQASRLEPGFALSWLAQGEQARAEGERKRARELFDKALGADGRELRAELWRQLLAPGAGDLAALKRNLEQLAERVAEGSEADKLLAASISAFAELSAGDPARARASLSRVGAPSALRVADPELLAFFSEQALALGEHALAYRAARLASDAGGGAQRYQALVAAALLQQGEGEAALSLLSTMQDGHGALALARGAAALLTDSRVALESAKKELSNYRATQAGKEDVEATSLLMRLDLRLGANVESLMPTARALVRRAPNAVAAHLALGEALVDSGEGVPAVETLETALRLSPGSADAHYLLGRALRLGGRATEARQSLERAVAIAPNHIEARVALGRTLLDGGEFEAALALFRGLESASAGSAMLGRAEALIGRGSADEAAAQLASLPEPLKAAPEAQLLRARLAQLRGRPNEALALLEPLTREDAELRSAEALTLYGDALYALDRVDSAAAAYDAALELDDQHPDALIGRAIAAVRAERADQALALLQRAEGALSQGVRPPGARALLLMTAARADLIKRQYESAGERLAQALAIPGAPKEAYFWYGEVLARSKAESAAAQYAKYLELDPKGPYAARAKHALALD